jgi:hypothetical protein
MTGKSMAAQLVLYTYRCQACGRAGEERLRGDSHDSEESACSVCGEAVKLEWDGGMTFDTPRSLSDNAIERARRGTWSPTENTESKKQNMNRPDYEALDGQGLPYVRTAKIVGELPTPECRTAALKEASEALGRKLGLKVHRTISFGTPSHLAFNMTRPQAKNHAEARLLLTKGEDLSLDHCPTYNWVRKTHAHKNTDWNLPTLPRQRLAQGHGRNASSATLYELLRAEDGRIS